MDCRKVEWEPGLHKDAVSMLTWCSILRWRCGLSGCRVIPLLIAASWTRSSGTAPYDLCKNMPNQPL